MRMSSKNAEEIVVSLNDGRHLAAKRAGADLDTDVAVIRVQADNLSNISYGDSNGLRVGDYVVAIGNPFGLEGTATLG